MDARGLLLIIGLLLGGGTLGGACSIPEARRGTLDSLLRVMLYSVGELNWYPNPNLLIALRLARDHHLETERRLTQQLTVAAARELYRICPVHAEEFSLVPMALYTLALRSACINTEHIEHQGRIVNLLEAVEDILNEEIRHIESHSFPLSNYYQVSMDIFSLCVHRRPLTEDMVRVITDAVEGNRFTLGRDFSADTDAVATMALWCVSDRAPALSTSAVAQSLRSLLDRLLAAVQPDGLIGNVYSTGMAVQALSVAGNLIPPGSWNCSKTLERLLLSAEDGSLNNPQAASQITPSLEGRTYLDVGSIDCRDDKSNLTLPELSTSSTPQTEPPPIHVWYNVTDGLGGTFSDKVLVTVPRGSSLLTVMMAARDLDPLRFSFQFQMTLWGPVIYSIQGLVASTENRTYWSLWSGSKPLEQGIVDYIPSDGETIEIILSRY